MVKSHPKVLRCEHYTTAVKSQLNVETTIERALLLLLLLLLTWRNHFSKTVEGKEKEINCEQTEILTALIMAENRDSARVGIRSGL